jgi:hypothetical protein
MGKDDKGALGTLGQLMEAAKSDQPKLSGDEQLAHDMERILKLAEQLAGENIFDQQFLIESCADEIRSQIREEVEGEDP